ncbi:hypothetical protein BC831DRAFT_508450 [Entophlyctis helioformis]|nr:hypothetical protein BC831DRAFT_508450 [Entophlyctis helioformis]
MDGPSEGFAELKDALRENLAARGVLARFEAAMRAEVFKALDADAQPPPPATRETALVNELIREYLRYNGYGHSLSVFSAEAGLPKDIPEREYISQELSIHPKLYQPQLPLLYGLSFKHRTQANPDRLVRDVDHGSSAIDTAKAAAAVAGLEYAGAEQN